MRKFHEFEKHHKFLIGFLVSIGVIFFWRGVWQLLDTFFFPNQWIISNVASLIFGVGILAFVYYWIDFRVTDHF